MNEKLLQERLQKSIVRITWGKTVFIQELLTYAEYTKKYVGG